METTIDAPASGGKTVKITGEVIGPFMLHKSVNEGMIGLKDIQTFAVTHIASGNRMPFDFVTKEGAERFADEVQDVHDWSGIQTQRPLTGSQTQAAWVSGKPSSDTIRLIKKIAAQCGGVGS